MLDKEAVRCLPPGDFRSMGTNGLTPAELRALHHALLQANPSGKEAASFVEMVEGKVRDLEDFDPEYALPDGFCQIVPCFSPMD